MGNEDTEVVVPVVEEETAVEETPDAPAPETEATEPAVEAASE